MPFHSKPQRVWDALRFSARDRALPCEGGGYTFESSGVLPFLEEVGEASQLHSQL
jgi:hypothetical protein